jgi:hypothetical protein
MIADSLRMSPPSRSAISETGSDLPGRTTRRAELPAQPLACQTEVAERPGQRRQSTVVERMVTETVH